MTHDCSRIAGLGELAGKYDGILCDVWGVMHNGVASWPSAVDALARYREQGGTVVMITNAPRPKEPIIEQLAGLGVHGECFDAVVTSGDVTRLLVGDMSPRVFHIGPDRDLTLYDGLDVELVERDHAGTVVCTGLFDDTTETPEDYRDLLAELRARDLPFICANPDIVVERGDSLIWCAGALARDYRAIGGEVHIVGKPHRPIYERAMAVLSAAAGRTLDKGRILAIGDGMETDVAGAAGFGLDLLYVSAGIHAGEYGNPDTPDEKMLQHFLQARKAAPVAWLPRLKW
jgi:HAD superfamily hydrolase (TIGR01459 family)